MRVSSYRATVSRFLLSLEFGCSAAIFCRPCARVHSLRELVRGEGRVQNGGKFLAQQYVKVSRLVQSRIDFEDWEKDFGKNMILLELNTRQEERRLSIFLTIPIENRRNLYPPDRICRSISTSKTLRGRSDTRVRKHLVITSEVRWARRLLTTAGSDGCCVATKVHAARMTVDVFFVLLVYLVIRMYTPHDDRGLSIMTNDYPVWALQRKTG